MAEVSQNTVFANISPLESVNQIIVLFEDGQVQQAQEATEKLLNDFSPLKKSAASLHVIQDDSNTTLSDSVSKLSLSEGKPTPVSDEIGK